ncbi:MAG: xanthine dehydrogenase molybdopterin binding subunit [Bacteroidales bacterium]|nr:xanthine dehydrogenase molybdopterin binding subunit [Bacteroidales bacterium]MDD3525990.1 xanthine dehydrogenase molybdopterin binding subunit [Bacteroidales bacterium]
MLQIMQNNQPTPQPHHSALQHVTGRSVFVNDMGFGDQLLFGRVVFSQQAHANIRSICTQQARAAEGVVAVLTAADIPGLNQMGPVVPDEPCLATDQVSFFGQAVALIAARTEAAARKAASLLNIEYEPLPAITDLGRAIAENSFLTGPRQIATGDVGKAFENAEHVLNGTLHTGAQEHWYLETQSCMCVPEEAGQMMVYSSTQHPAETQAIVAQVLAMPANAVTVEVKRMGGAFGGKETQANHIAAWTALLAHATKHPVKMHLFRDDDQMMTGKRHRFRSEYRAAYNAEGYLLALDVALHSDGGAALDLSVAILERAMFHIDNAYYIPNLRVTGQVWKTNLPPNTAFRGFGGPQGIAVVETVIDCIARLLHKDAAEIRKLNFYKNGQSTHYGQQLTEVRLEKLFGRLTDFSYYPTLRRETEVFNKENEFIKKGLALTPVKFGISFTTSFLNQAGALVHIYGDGSVQVNHGGTEMGQGLHTKMLEVACRSLGLPPERVIVTATNTSKVPNTSATAASSGSDLNGMAVKNAIDKLISRLTPIAQSMLKINKDAALIFADGKVAIKDYPNKKIAFEDVVSQAYLHQVSLSATGYYRTPGLFFDKTAGKGTPFYYFAYGMAVSQVQLDTLTGDHRILKTYIVHDVGDSINTAIDLGQIEGGFVQGVGWCTTEEIKWDDKGFLTTHSPDTYKIPGVRNIPEIFEIEIARDMPNAGTIQNSKAVGEPPLMLALSVWLALKDAISAVGNHQQEPPFDLPATNDSMLKWIEEMRKLQ